MKRIIININKPYTNYNAFKALRADIDMVFDGLQVPADFEQYYGNVWSRIDGIMNRCEYYKRGNNSEAFSCNYSWYFEPSRERCERINIYSITGKEVGNITVQ